LNILGSFGILLGFIRKMILSKNPIKNNPMSSKNGSDRNKICCRRIDCLSKNLDKLMEYIHPVIDRSVSHNKIAPSLLEKEAAIL